MINRELQSASVTGFAHDTAAPYNLTVDQYGQLEAGIPRTIHLAVKVYSQQNVADPRYVDVELIGLTKDTSVAPGEVISLASGNYRVKYVLPTGRWNELMLVRL